MKTMAVVNQKGGQAKSTTTFHLAAEAVAQKKRTLVFDNDVQGSLSLLIAATPGNEPGLLSSALYSDEASALKPEVINEYLSIIRVDKAHKEIADGAMRNPAKHLKHFAKDFDVCFIDTPGALNSRVISSLIAADVVVCPVSVGLLEMAGLADLWAFIKAVKTKGYNAKLRVMGMLPSKVNPKSPEEQEGLDVLRQQFGSAILPHVLYERAAVKQAITKRRPVWVGTKGAGHLKAAQEWKAACGYILKNLGV